MRGAGIFAAAMVAAVLIWPRRSDAMQDATRSGEIETSDNDDLPEFETVYFDEGLNMANEMDLSAQGLELLKSREGFSASPYFDFHGYSIGYGHLDIKLDEFNALSDEDKAAYLAKTISEEDATALLLDDVEWAADSVRDLVSVPVTQNQFDALVSLVFNIGRGAFAGSTLLRLLNASDYEGAAAQFARWNRAGGSVHPGLVARREHETEQFTGAA